LIIDTLFIPVTCLSLNQLLSLEKTDIRNLFSWSSYEKKGTQLTRCTKNLDFNKIAVGTEKTSCFIIDATQKQELISPLSFKKSKYFVFIAGDILNRLIRSMPFKG